MNAPANPSLNKNNGKKRIGMRVCCMFKDLHEKIQSPEVGQGLDWGDGDYFLHLFLYVVPTFK